MNNYSHQGKFILGIYFAIPGLLYPEMGTHLADFCGLQPIHFFTYKKGVERSAPRHRGP